MLFKNSKTYYNKVFLVTFLLFLTSCSLVSKEIKTLEDEYITIHYNSFLELSKPKAHTKKVSYENMVQIPSGTFFIGNNVMPFNTDLVTFCFNRHLKAVFYAKLHKN